MTIEQLRKEYNETTALPGESYASWLERRITGETHGNLELGCSDIPSSRLTPEAREILRRNSAALAELTNGKKGS